MLHPEVNEPMTTAARSFGSRSAGWPRAADVVLVGAILMVGTAWHIAGPANTDIAWLLTVGGRILDGAVPYRDIIETNPPGSVLLYLPAVLIGRASRLDAQAVAMGLTGLACAACLLGCASALRPVMLPGLRGPLTAAVAAVLVLLPLGSFGQREHVIFMTTLPLLCGVASRSVGGAGRRAAALAGAAAAVGFAVKPYYVLGLVGPAVLLWRRRGWRALAGSVDLWTAGCVAGALLCAQLLLFPAFAHDVLPLLVRIYLPQRQPMADLLGTQIGPAAIAALGAAFVTRRLLPHPDRAVAALADTAALASGGFFAAYLIQGKGWPYQAYPAVASALVSLAVTVLLSPPNRGGSKAWLARVAASALAGFGAPWFDARLDIDVAAPGLVAAVARLGPHPRVMSVASDIAIGHPLVRRVGGVWVGTLMSGWIEQCVTTISGSGARQGPYAAELAFEARTMASDIRDRDPDAVLALAATWDRWIARKPEVAAALVNYHPAGTYGIVTLWTRVAP